MYNLSNCTFFFLIPEIQVFKILNQKKEGMFVKKRRGIAHKSSTYKIFCYIMRKTFNITRHLEQNFNAGFVFYFYY
jgi:hypothetical protein